MPVIRIRDYKPTMCEEIVKCVSLATRAVKIVHTHTHTHSLNAFQQQNKEGIFSKYKNHAQYSLANCFVWWLPIWRMSRLISNSMKIKF